MMPLAGQLSPLGRAVGAVAAFVPTDIAGLKLWLKADAGLFQDSAGTIPATLDSDPVGRWSDQSGQGNHATQTTAGKRPTLRTNQQNSMGIVRADGTDDALLLTSNVVLTGDFTVWWVAKLNNATSRSYYGNAGSVADILQLTDTTLRIRNDASGAATVTHASIGTSSYALIEMVRSGSTVTRYKNSTADGTLTLSGTVTLNELFVRSAAASFGSMDMGETGIYDSALSTDNRGLLETYLNTRWAVY